jgi:hypothetical protein
VLRAPDGEGRRAAYEGLVADLKVAAAEAQKSGRSGKVEKWKK